MSPHLSGEDAHLISVGIYDFTEKNRRLVPRTNFIPFVSRLSSMGGRQLQ